MPAKLAERVSAPGIARHVYMRVPAGDSPRGIDGFQTVHACESLSRDDVRQVEEHIVYTASGKSPRKRLCYRLSCGKVALTQIDATAETDGAGRTGLYLARSLVFPDAAAFGRAGGNPLRVLNAFPPLNSSREALELCRAGRIEEQFPATACGAPAASELDAARRWPRQELIKLARLALGADRLRRSGLSVAFLGGEAEREQALEAALFAIPAGLRARCTWSFPLHRSESNYFWAVGLETPSSRFDRMVVEAGRRQVHLPPDFALDSLYARLVCRLIDEDRLDEVPPLRETFDALCSFIERRPYDKALIAAAPDQAIEQVYRLDPELSRQRILECLSEHVPGPLARRCLETLPATLSDRRERPDHGVCFRPVATGRLRPAHLAEALYCAYRERKFEPPPKQECAELDRWLSRFRRPAKLHALAAHWSGRAESLNGLRDDEYARFVHDALRTRLRRPVELLDAGREPLLIRAARQHKALDKDNLLDLIEALGAQGRLDGGLLDDLYEIYRRRPSYSPSRRERRRLARGIAGHEATPMGILSICWTDPDRLPQYLGHCPEYETVAATLLRQRRCRADQLFVAGRENEFIALLEHHALEEKGLLRLARALSHSSEEARQQVYQSLVEYVEEVSDKTLRKLEPLVRDQLERSHPFRQAVARESEDRRTARQEQPWQWKSILIWSAVGLIGLALTTVWGVWRFLL